MSIKGFPSSQKLPLGTGITNEFATVVPSDKYRYSLDVNRPLFRVDSAVAPRTAAASTGNIDGMTWVYDTSTPALKGDFVRFETGNAQYIEVPIVKVETNRFMLGALVSPAPAAGDTFYILRSVSPLVGSDGTASITASNPSVGTNNSTAPVSSTEIGIIDGTGKLQGVSSSNPVPVSLTGSGITLVNGFLSTANSSTTPLGIAASFTGTAADITNYSAVEILVATDRSGILNMQFSSDGTNWDHDDAYACTVTTGGVTQSFYFQSAPIAKYFRVKYDNDGTAQGVFRLQTVFKVNAGVGDIQDLSTAPVDASNGMVTKSVIYGLTTGGGGGYKAVKVNPSGALTTDVSGTVAATQSGTWNVGLNAGTNLVGKVGIDQTTNGTTNAVYVNNFPATQPVSGTVAATQSGTWNIGTLSTITNPVAVTGTFYQATQPVSGTFWQATQPVSVTALPATTGRAKVGQLYNDYTTTNVTTAAYVQLTASTAATVNQIEIFDSSGEALILAVGAATSEVDQLYIFPGGNGPVQLAIPASSRISVKAKTATASAGFLAINLYS